MISYKGTPLFGEDSNPSHTSEFFAIAGTLLFWLIFILCAFVIKPGDKKPKYKEVQIVLSSTPVVQKTEEAPAPAEQAASTASPVSSQTEQPQPEVAAVKAEPVKESPAPAKSQPVKNTSTAAKTKPAAKPKTESKSTAKTAATKPAAEKKAAEPVEYALDPMEAFAQQTKQQPKKEFDWSQFDEEETSTSNTTSAPKTVSSNVPAFEGAAGTAASSESTAVKSSSSTSTNKNSTASSSTSSALKGIKNSTYTGKAQNGVSSETNVKAKTSGSGKVEMEMSNGHTRALLDPTEPVINIPPELYHLIDSSRTVSISFTVVNSGNVTNVKITPESSLHSSIRQEIIGQLLFWRFEPADYSATASFEYKIVKR